MNERSDRLYQLLPSVYRQRDAELGQPLRALLRVISEQVNIVEDDISQLYENWFIETCDDWVVPYIGDLVGFRVVHEAGEPGSPSTSEGLQRNKILIPRREVAHTIRNRRRKGTLSVLEMLARDVSGWPSRAVEFYQLLGVAQNINYRHLDRGRTVDLRVGDALDRINGPFDELAHTVDVRSINSHRTDGRYNIPSVGLFVWRLKPYSITRAPAHKLDTRGSRRAGKNRFTFSALTNDQQLYTLPVNEPAPTHIADEMNVPTVIRRRAFEERASDYYGPGKSLMIWLNDLKTPISVDHIVSADLSHWTYRPMGDQVAVDPVLGRIILADERTVEDLYVSYHYAFSADVGGGEYERPLRPSSGRKVYRVSKQGASAEARYASIQAALDAWSNEPDQHQYRDVIIEIEDSDVYTEYLEIKLKMGQRLELRAANGARPVIRMENKYISGGEAFTVNGIDAPDETGPAPQFIMDGILIMGRGMQVKGRLGRVLLRHCTLVPGWSLDCDCEPENEMDPSLILSDTTARLAIEHSIVGTILQDQNEVKTDPLDINISDSIIDAIKLEYDALGVNTVGHLVAHAVLTIRRSTVLGQIAVHAIDLAENSIFQGHVLVARSQRGCMRFCYAPANSHTPRRYHCQPDGVLAGLMDEGQKAQAEMRVRPQFNSVRYGTPVYCQLAVTCAEEITRGADDGSEMGVFHDLFQPQREANLRTRLDEYTPAGMNAGFILVN
ncbi:MAG: hypothetical protein QOD00_2521 [Blastocatellia bacterium]|jgi:hypothetical protein|nr:hypothetical protein [Blastocatellia bacterium]